ncbi:MAG: RnfABCDGE type electron transport complex subunit D [Minisyncoccia bacterium]|jgi:ferredoxin-NADP reductase
MLNAIDSFLNQITMYRLLLYVLAAFLAIAAAFGALGILPYSPAAIAFSTAVLLVVAWITNQLFAKTFGAQPNVESVYITALILALIIAPVAPSGIIADMAGLSFLIWAAVWAMACKYMLAIKKKHLFNPAAFAVALTALTINQSANWWIGGNLPTLAFVLIGGFLIVRKIRRFDLVFSFLLVGLATTVLTNTTSDPVTTLQKIFLHTPIFFFASVMLTEPLTTPPTRTGRIAYGALVGLLFAPAIHLGSVYSTPELALLVGNVFSYFISPKGKYVFSLKKKVPAGTSTYDFAFATDGPISFRPGQYMEWTLGHKKSDSRGNRRYFTVASSPTEPALHLGVKFYESSSSFKKRMLTLQPGDEIVGGQLAGDFVLPKDKHRKLVFLAGGIGITPFRSMVKYLVDREEKRDIVLFYSNRTADEISYPEIFDEAARTIGLRTIYTVTGADGPLPEGLYRGRINANLIAKAIPDYRDRTFYISGTRAMVTSLRETLREMHIPGRHIKTDFFPGFA